MKGNRLVLIAAVVLVTLVTPAQAPSAGQQAFDKLKSLAGEWEGTNSSGLRATASYRLTSDGTVLAETLRTSHDEMLTTYYLDNGRLMMTHYCGAGNQPRMITAGLSPDGKRIAFAFQDATNLPDPNAGHMQALELTLEDVNHLTQRWTWREKARDVTPEVFQLTRVK